MLNFCPLCKQEVKSGDFVMKTARISTSCGIYNGYHITKPHMEQFVYNGVEKLIHLSCVRKVLSDLDYEVGTSSRREINHDS